MFEYGLRTFVSKKRRRKAFLFVLSLVFQAGKFLPASPHANVLEKVCRGRFFFTSPSPFFCFFSYIGTAARHVREIGAAVNGATGNVLQNHPYYNKAMQVASQVERGAAAAAEIGGDIQNRLN